MSKVEVLLKLSPEDQDAICARVAEQLEAAKGGSKPAKGKPGRKPKAAPEPEPEDDFDDVDGDATGADDADADDEFDAAEDDAPTYERSDVQAALRELALVTSKSNAMTVLREHGDGNGLSDLSEDKFGAVIKAANVATAKAKKTKKGK